MLQIQENYSLRNNNTFGVEAKARWFTEINSEEELIELFSNLEWQNAKRLVLGGGSNILFTQDFDGLVVKMNIRHLSHEVHGNEVKVTAGGGEVWNSFVKYTVDLGFAGAENLSLIPGSVGASPIQNIGAYGVELKDIFYSCRAFHIPSGEILVFNNSDCRFAYRDSIFKNELKGKVIVTEVTFKLSTVPVLNTEYGAISLELEKRNINNPTIKDISNIVSEIRVGKLPDPSTIGNAGSFFKNPIIPVDKFRQLQSIFPDIVHFSMGKGFEKVAAGWLIEKVGWKGKKIGNAGTWKNQALVLVNHGSATGTEIYDLSSRIISDVEKEFGVKLEREVNIV